MRALITGATGFVGSHLADFLIDSERIEVHGIIRPRSREEFVRKDVTYHEADILDYKGLSSIIKDIKPELVFHLAAQSFVPLSWKAPQSTLTTNIIGTLNVLEAVLKESPDTTVQVAGSSEEYGMVYPDEVPIRESNPLRPLSPYGVSKVAADLLAQQYNKSFGVKTVITRAFNHTGPRRGEVFATSSFAKQLVEIEKGKKEPILKVGNLDAQRDWTDVRDVVRAYYLATKGCTYGVPYNICSGKSWEVGHMLSVLIDLTGLGGTLKVEQDPERMRPSDVIILLGSAEKFKKTTGWEQLYTFEETLADLLDYWRKKI